MKRFVSLILIFVFLYGALNIKCSALSLSAESAVLYCADNNRFYYSLNENKRIYPASTTKIMTALLTLEYAEKDNKKVKFREDMTAEGSSMYLKIGEVVTLRDLAVGILMCSGNDAANAAAFAIAGSKEKFSKLMNRRAEEIGMKNTNFITPSGLHAPGHYTTARDMALLMAEALKNPVFKKLTSKRSETVRFINPAGKVTAYSNHNRLLSIYRDCIGGKTGYTSEAGRCLVTASKKDGLTFIAATFNDRNDWRDHVSLYDFGYDNYRMKTIDDSEFFIDVPTVGGTDNKTTVLVQGKSCLVLKAGEYDKVKRGIIMDSFLYAPKKEGEAVGKVVYSLKGKVIAEHKIIVAKDNNSIIENKNIWESIKGFFNNAF